MNLVFLEGYGQLRRLAKTFIRRADGTLIKQAYPNAHRMTSYNETVDTLVGFEEALKKHAAEYRALFTGQLTKPLVSQSRKGMARKNNKLEWVCLDFDGVDADSVEQIMSEIAPLADVSYIVAYSASHGFKPGVNAHVFFLLEGAFSHERLVGLVTGMNWYVPRLRNQLRLGESKAHLSKSLDTAGVRAAGLIYIAPPILQGVEDPCGGLNSRIQLVRKPKDSVSMADFPEVWTNDIMTKDSLRTHLNSLRAMEGLPPVKDALSRIEVDGVVVDYDSTPDTANITLTGGPLSVNGLVRCNLNEGDSGAYFFDYGYITDGTDGTNVTLMHNFKGEPPFALAKANPKFAKAWNAWLRQEEEKSVAIPEWLKDCPVPIASEVTRSVDDTQQGAVEAAETEQETADISEDKPNPRRLIFRDGFTDQHYEFETLEDSGTPLFSQISGDTARKQAVRLGIKYSKDEGFPTLYRIFDPTRPDLFFTINGKPMINLFAQPKLINFKAKKTRSLDDTVAEIKRKCPTIYTSIAHPMCYDDEAVRRMINWMAVHVTMPHVRVNTAWLLRGVPGSGKSNIIQGVLSTLLGYGQAAAELAADAARGYCSNVSTEAMTGGFNGIFLDSRFMEVAEAETGGAKSKDHEMLKQTFKRLVTQEFMDINEKYGRQRKNVKTYNAYIFTSNYHDTFPIDTRDRRYNVPRYQDQPIKEVIPEVEHFFQEYIPLISAEVGTLGALMSSMKVDVELSQRVYDGGDKDEIIEAGQPVGDLFVYWIKNGEFDRVAEAILSGLDVRQTTKGLTPVEETAVDYLSYVANVSKSDHVPRDLLQRLYAATFPAAATLSSAAFSRKLNAAGLKPQSVRPGRGISDLLGLSGGTMRCVPITWTSDNFGEWTDHPRIRGAFDGMQSKQAVMRMAAA